MRTQVKALNQWQYPCIVAAALALSAAAPRAAADEAGYAFASDGDVVRSSTGECVHTSSWSPGDAIPGCDGYQAQVSERQVETPRVAVVEEAEVAVMEPVTYTLDTETFFDFDKAELRPEGKDELDTIARRIRNEATISTVEVTGYTDPIGPEEYNRKLSQQRAEAVSAYLSRQAGIDSDKFRVRGEGEADPVAGCQGMQGNALIECLQPNRRAEIAINVEKSGAR